MPPFVTLSEAETHLSELVDRAAAGEEIVIAKNEVPQVSLSSEASRRLTFTLAAADAAIRDYPNVAQIWAG